MTTEQEKVEITDAVGQALDGVSSNVAIGALSFHLGMLIHQAETVGCPKETASQYVADCIATAYSVAKRRELRDKGT